MMTRLGMETDDWPSRESFDKMLDEHIRRLRQGLDVSPIPLPCSALTNRRPDFSNFIMPDFATLYNDQDDGPKVGVPRRTGKGKGRASHLRKRAREIREREKVSDMGDSNSGTGSEDIYSDTSSSKSSKVFPLPDMDSIIYNIEASNARSTHQEIHSLSEKNLSNPKPKEKDLGQFADADEKIQNLSTNIGHKKKGKKTKYVKLDLTEPYEEVNQSELSYMTTFGVPAGCEGSATLRPASSTIENTGEKEAGDYDVLSDSSSSYSPSLSSKSSEVYPSRITNNISNNIEPSSLTPPEPSRLTPLHQEIHKSLSEMNLSNPKEKELKPFVDADEKIQNSSPITRSKKKSKKTNFVKVDLNEPYEEYQDELLYGVPAGSESSAAAVGSGFYFSDSLPAFPDFKGYVPDCVQKQPKTRSVIDFPYLPQQKKELNNSSPNFMLPDKQSQKNSMKTIASFVATGVDVNTLKTHGEGAPRESQDPSDGTVVVLENVPKTINKEAIKDFLGDYGTVTHVRTEKCGEGVTAYVTMDDAETADWMAEILDDSEALLTGGEGTPLHVYVKNGPKLV